MHKEAGVGIKEMFDHYLKDPIDLGYGKDGVDQSFLGSYVYPLLKSRLLVHYSNKRGLIGENVIEFPIQNTEIFHCGRVDGANIVDGGLNQSSSGPQRALVGGRFKLS
jgi:hypothetical protein